MATMVTTESGFQNPARERPRDHLLSHLLVNQPTTSPSTYKNKTPLIVTGIDPKFK